MRLSYFNLICPSFFQTGSLTLCGRLSPAKFPGVLGSLYRELDMYNVAPKKFAVEILKEKEDLLDQLAENISGVGANNEDCQRNTSNLRFRSIIEKILAWMSEPIEKRARIYAAEQAAINSSTTDKDPFSKDSAIALEKYFECGFSPSASNANNEGINLINPDLNQSLNAAGKAKQQAPGLPNKGPTEQPLPLGAFARQSNFYTQEQKHILDMFYIMRSKYPSKEDIKLLAAQVSCQEKHVGYYFNNHRTRLGSNEPPPQPQATFGRKPGSKFLSADQKHVLDQYYILKSMYPSNEDIILLAAQLNITEKSVKYYFNNKRTRFGEKEAPKLPQDNTSMKAPRDNASIRSTERGQQRQRNDTQTDTAFNTTLANNQGLPSITKIKTEPGECTSTSSRKQLDADQWRSLELYFTRRSQYPSREDIELLAKLLGMQERTIKIFFQNRRAKAKRLEETFGDSSEPIDSTTGRKGVRSKYLLEQFFTLQSQYPTKKDIELLGRLSDINEHSVKIWFQNRRAKAAKEFVRGTGFVKLKAPQSQSTTFGKRKGTPCETLPYFLPSPVKQELLEENEQNNVVYTTQIIQLETQGLQDSSWPFRSHSGQARMGTYFTPRDKIPISLRNFHC